MKQSGESRRSFIKKTAALATVAFVPRYVLGGRGYIAPSDQVTLGFIGTGRLSPYLASNFVGLEGVRIVAGCDVYKAKGENFKKSVEKAYADKLEKDSYKGLDLYGDYMEILDRSDIDAVVVVTPDHWHAKPSIDAMKHGKDVYCEKPLSHTIEEGRRMVEVARETNSVLQTGSMQRSWENFRHACELVCNGYIGEIKSIKVSVGDPAIKCNLGGESVPEGLNWDVWLGAAKNRSFNAILAPPPDDKGWPAWRAYREFGGGYIADWGAHMFDIAQWALRMDNSGPVEIIPPDDPTAVRGLKFIYANGVEMTHEDFGRGNAIEFTGTEGVISLSREHLESSPTSIVSEKITDSDERLYFSENHYQNWIDCIKSREKPICDVEVGHRSATVCHLANIGYQLGKPLKWDPEKEEFDDKKANKLKSKKYRNGYEIG